MGVRRPVHGRHGRTTKRTAASTNAARNRQTWRMRRRGMVCCAVAKSEHCDYNYTFPKRPQARSAAAFCPPRPYYPHHLSSHHQRADVTLTRVDPHKDRAIADSCTSVTRAAPAPAAAGTGAHRVAVLMPRATTSFTLMTRAAPCTTPRPAARRPQAIFNAPRPAPRRTPSGSSE